MGKLKVIKAPPVCSIQDRGRFGVRKWGTPQSGFMDGHAANRANQLVGNVLDAALIEFAIGALEVEALSDLDLAIVGVGTEKVLSLKKGQQCYIKQPSRVYGYLAIAGDLHGKEDFGSMSTYPPAKFGGLNGEQLKNGDEVTIKEVAYLLTNELELPDYHSNKFRIIKGPEWHFLKDDIIGKPFAISNENNRMAIKLNGKMKVDRTAISSSAVIPGIIQVPPSGVPIVLMNDCQTTGGYPRIAKVIDEDLGRLAQIRGEICFNLSH